MSNLIEWFTTDISKTERKQGEIPDYADSPRLKYFSVQNFHNPHFKNF